MVACSGLFIWRNFLEPFLAKSWRNFFSCDPHVTPCVFAKNALLRAIFAKKGQNPCDPAGFTG